MSTADASFEGWDPEYGFSTRSRALHVALFLAVLGLIGAQLLLGVRRPPSTALWFLEFVWLFRTGVVAARALAMSTLRVDASGLTRTGSPRQSALAWSEAERVVHDPRRALLLVTASDGAELQRIRLGRYDESLRGSLEQALIAHGGARFERGRADPPRAPDGHQTLPDEHTLTDEVGCGRAPIPFLIVVAVSILVGWEAGPATGASTFMLLAIGVLIVMAGTRLRVTEEGLAVGRALWFEPRLVPWTDLEGLDAPPGQPLQLLLRDGTTAMTHVRLGPTSVARLASTIRHRQIELAFGEEPAT